ncbi:MAG: KOW domain-containing RNA-binding protein [Veillonellales bacterium]
MSAQQIAVGQLVISTAGRDTGQVYVVIGYGRGQILLLADGKKRQLAKPKQKNVRHINVLEAIAGNVADKLKTGACVTNEEIRRSIHIVVSMK